MERINLSHTRSQEPYDVFWDGSDRFLPADSSTTNLLLFPEDTIPIGDLYRDIGLDRKRNPLLYKHPLLLVNKACTKYLLSNFDVLFQDDFQAICAHPSEEKELLFLTAFFASPLAQYLLFHTTANIGIERDVARLEEMLELPFPLPEDMPDPEYCKDIINQCAQCLNDLRKELKRHSRFFDRDALVSDATAELTSLVYKYYGLSEWEQHLVTDTVEVFRRSSTPASFNSDKLYTIQHSTKVHREAYAETLIKTFHSHPIGSRK